MGASLPFRAPLLVPALLLAWAGCGTNDESDGILGPQEMELLRRLGPIGDPPPSPTNQWADDPDAARLGQAFFFDWRFSADGSVSCATCHDPAHGFGDPRPVSIGAHGAKGRRHAQTVVNMAWNRFFFWDGRADTLWAQPIQAIESELEGDFSRTEVAHLINAAYRARYEAIFGRLPDEIENLPPAARPGDEVWQTMTPAEQDLVHRIAANVGKALEAYMRRLVSRNSALDRFLEGDEDALTEAQKRGAVVFVSEEKGRCIACHDGPNLSDNDFHNLGIPDPSGDTGRYDGVIQLLADPLTGDGPYSDAPGRRLAGLSPDPTQRGRFKTPTLRDVSKRAPYGHTGQFETLEDYIEFHDRGGGDPGSYVGEKHELMRPLGLTEQEKADLVEFLRALDGEPLPEELLQPPL